MFMPTLRLQKRLAASILKVGQSRVWLDPERLDDIKSAITRADIRRLIKEGAIKALPPKIKKPKEKKKRRKGPGRRKGSRKAGKDESIKTVRALRKFLKELRDSGKITRRQYRELYLKVKGGMFRSRAHLKLYLRDRGIMKEE